MNQLQFTYNHTMRPQRDWKQLAWLFLQWMPFSEKYPRDTHPQYLCVASAPGDSKWRLMISGWLNQSPSHPIPSCASTTAIKVISLTEKDEICMTKLSVLLELLNKHTSMGTIPHRKGSPCVKPVWKPWTTVMQPSRGFCRGGASDH